MDDSPRRESETEESAPPRRAVIKALASAPVILTLISGRARAEYFEGEYFEGSIDPACKVPRNDDDPDDPEFPEGCPHPPPGT